MSALLFGALFLLFSPSSIAGEHLEPEAQEDFILYSALSCHCGDASRPIVPDEEALFCKPKVKFEGKKEEARFALEGFIVTDKSAKPYRTAGGVLRNPALEKRLGGIPFYTIERQENVTWGDHHLYLGIQKTNGESLSEYVPVPDPETANQIHTDRAWFGTKVRKGGKTDGRVTEVNAKMSLPEKEAEFFLTCETMTLEDAKKRVFTEKVATIKRIREAEKTANKYKNSQAEFENEIDKLLRIANDFGKDSPNREKYRKLALDLLAETANSESADAALVDPVARKIFESDDQTAIHYLKEMRNLSTRVRSSLQLGEGEEKFKDLVNARAAIEWAPRLQLKYIKDKPFEAELRARYDAAKAQYEAFLKQHKLKAEQINYRGRYTPLGDKPTRIRIHIQDEIEEGQIPTPIGPEPTLADPPPTDH